MEQFELKDAFRIEQLSLEGSSIALEVAIYGDDLGRKPALFILNSHEYPMPPEPEFARRAMTAGWQVIFIRRPGYGGSPSLPVPLFTKQNIKNRAAVTSEAALLARFISQYASKGSVLLSLSSSNPVSFRISQFCDAVSLFVFANPVFNQPIWDSFSPTWFRIVLEQIVSSPSGVRMSHLGIKHFLRRNTIKSFRQVLSQSPGGIQYITRNESSVLTAAMGTREGYSRRVSGSAIL